MNQAEKYCRTIKRLCNNAILSPWQSIINTCNSNAGKTYTKSVSTFGSFGTASGKWAGAVLAPNGKIYGIPRNATNILEIDPSTDTVTTWGATSGNNAYMGGVLAPNGYIYCPPSNGTNILKINIGAGTLTNFTSAALLSGYLDKI